MTRSRTLPALRRDLVAAAGEPRRATDQPSDLRVSGLWARYGAQVALRDVDLHVRTGTCVAVLGANGAGKTTLLNAISGAHRPVVGQIRLGELPLEQLLAPEVFTAGVCHVPEGRGIFPSLSVAENLRLTVDDAAQDLVVERFPRLRERLGQRAGTLSGGEQQMLAMAPALAGAYQLLLVDEVSLGLAPVIVDELLAALADIRAAGKSIVIVEQFAERALALADHAYVLRKGEVVFAGPAAELRSHDDLLARLYLGA